MRIFATLTIALVAAACHPGEGERCNPMLFTDECDTALACTYPPNCGVAYCCPTAAKSNNANCQACAPRDGGASN